VAIYLVFIIGIATIIIEKQKIKLPDKWMLLGIGLFIVAAVLAIFVSPDKQAALGYFKAYIFDPILVYLLIVNFVTSRDDSRKIENGLLAGGIFVALQAIWQFFTGQVSADGRIVGLFGFSPNYLAMYLVPIIVLAAGLAYEAMKEKRYLNLFWNLLAVSTGAFAVYLTDSRAGLAAMIVGIIFVYYFIFWQLLKSKFWHRILEIAAAVIVAGFLIVLWNFARPDFTLSPANDGRIVSSNNIRWEIWRTSWEIIKQKTLLGVGLGNFQEYFTTLTKDRVNFPQLISPFALTPHNFFLAIWLNLGLLGLIAAVVLLIDFFVKRVRSMSLGAIFSFSAMAAILAFGLFDTPYFKNDLAIIFWMVLGLI